MQWFDPRMAGWYRKGSVPKHERVAGSNGSIPEWRDGTVKGRSPGGKRDESREKREERRGKSAERSEKRETSTTKISRLKYAMVRSQNGGMVQKRVGP